MHRIDASGHINNRFVDANLETGTPGTVCDAAFLNALQEEVATVIEGSALNLDKQNTGQLLEAIMKLAESTPIAMIPLMHWQTDPDERTVEIQYVYDIDGHGSDLLYHYVFGEAAAGDPIMYTQKMMPLAGYDLRFTFQYRMTTAQAGNVRWGLRYRVVSPGSTQAEILDYDTYNATDTVITLTHTPSTSANVYSFITDSLVIPAAAYSDGDILHVALFRDVDGAEDTHTGNAEVADCIALRPIKAS